MSAVAAGALPDGTPVIVSGSHDAHGAGVAAGRRHPGRGAADRPRRLVTAVAAGALPDGTPVIVSGSSDGTVRVWRLADGTPVGEPLTGHRGVDAVAVGALPDGTPVIVSGGYDETVRVWRLADGTPVGEPLLATADGARGGGRGAAGRHPGHRQRQPRRHGAGVAAGRRHPGRGAAARPHRLCDAVAAGALPDGTPVIVSGSHDGTVRVWRLADGTPVGEPLTGHSQRDRGGGRGAAGRHPGHRQRQRRRHGAGVAAGRRHPGRGTADRPHRLPDGGRSRGAAGRHPGHRQRRRRRHGAGVAAGRRHPGRGTADRPQQRGGRGGGRGAAGRHPGHRQRQRRTTRCGCGGWPTAPRSGSRCAATPGVDAVAVGALPDGTPVIVSGGDDGTVRVWRLADGTPLGEPLTGHSSVVDAVAVGALPDGTPVIVSGGDDNDDTVRVWRLADGTPLGDPLWLSASIGRRRSRRLHRHCGRGRHRRPSASAPATRACSCCAISGNNDRRRTDRIMAYYPVHQTAMSGEDLGTGCSHVRLGHVIRYIGREREAAKAWAPPKPDAIHGPRRRSNCEQASDNPRRDCCTQSRTVIGRQRQRRLATTAQALTAVRAHPALDICGLLEAARPVPVAVTKERCR